MAAAPGFNLAAFVSTGQRHYPIQEIEMLSESDEAVELAATLVPTSADPAELDALTAELERDPRVQNATWTVSALA